MNREAIYAALFALVSVAPGLMTASRKGKPLSQIEDAEMPALFQIQGGETWEQKKGVPSKVTLKADLEVYVSNRADPDSCPASVLNPILDYLQAALEPSAGDTQTLGGLVSHCWIAGALEVFEGLLENKTVALIPINILVP